MRALSATARQLLDRGEHQQAQSCVNQIRALVFGELMRHPAFLVGHFERLAEERYVAIDKALHDKHVQVSLAAIKAEDWDGLRRVNAGLIDNRFSSAPAEPLTSQMVGLVRGQTLQKETAITVLIEAVVVEPAKQSLIDRSQVELQVPGQQRASGPVLSTSVMPPLEPSVRYQARDECPVLALPAVLPTAVQGSLRPLGSSAFGHRVPASV